MSADGHGRFDPASAVAELQAAQIEISQAADAILFATEASLARLRTLRADQGADAGAMDDFERALCAILGACAFQDLSGQRLSKVERWLSGEEPTHVDALAQGPSLHGQGLDQAAADALFGETP